MMKVIVVFGTRPEAVKMCPLVKELRRHSIFDVTVCVTGQHKKMLEQVLDAFEVQPEYNLNIMKEQQTLYDITINVLDGIKQVLKEVHPDLVLVHGDTTTAFAASLAAFYEMVPVGHIEAGLRTYDLKAPYPEEFNRQAVGIIAAYHFAPTVAAKNNLLKEGKKENHIFVTGNTVIDALKTTINKNYTHPVLQWAEGSRMVLLTAHRRENMGLPLYNIFYGIRKVIDEVEDIKVIYPIHMNPYIRKVAEEVFGNHERMRIIEPLDVLDFHNFMNKAYVILTDSGGIQEEAPALGKPVLVMRDTTERPEGVEAGTLKLVGTSKDNIAKEFKKLLIDSACYESMKNLANPYGDGTACPRIAKILEKIYIRSNEHEKIS